MNGHNVTEVRVGLKSKLRFVCKGDQYITSLILVCPSQSKNINCRFQMSRFSIRSNRIWASRFLYDMIMTPSVTGNYWINYVTIAIANNSMMKTGNETKDSSGNTVDCFM